MTGIDLRVLIAVVPGSGHFNPTVPIARALSERGHEVAYVSSATFGSEIRRAGFNALEGGLDWTISKPSTICPNWDDKSEDERFAWWVDVITLEGPTAMFESLAPIVAETRPDCLVHEFYEFGTPLVSDRFGLPRVLIGTAPYFPPDIVQAYFGEGLEKLRGRHSMPVAQGGVYGSGYVSLLPHSYQVWDPYDCPSPHVAVRPTFYYGAGPTGNLNLPAQGGRLRAYVTLGTTFNDDCDLFSEIFDGLLRSGLDVVATVGSRRNVETLARWAPRVKLFSYLPHSQILPACDLVVHHGGFGTVLSCIANGLPSVVIPLMAEEAIHAQRMEDLGLGLYLSQSELSSEQVSEAARRILTEPGFRWCAQGLRVEWEHLADVVEAARLVESSVERGRA